MKALQRLVRYLGRSRWLNYLFKWQDETMTLVACVDTDFAGCMTTRRSTSGGLVLRGQHLLKHWSSTQKAITLSSAEAELGGIIKGCSEALGLQSISGDLGLTMDVEMKADASAAIGICRRAGVGRVRHLAVSQLWVQDLAGEEDEAQQSSGNIQHG